MENSSYRKVFLPTKTKNNLFKGENFLHIIDGDLPGNSVLEDSSNIILERGDYKGDDFAYNSSNMNATGGKYSGKYAP